MPQYATNAWYFFTDRVCVFTYYCSILLLNIVTHNSTEEEAVFGQLLKAPLHHFAITQSKPFRDDMFLINEDS